MKNNSINQSKSQDHMKENNDRKRKNRRFFEMIKKKLSEKMAQWEEQMETRNFR